LWIRFDREELTDLGETFELRVREEPPVAGQQVFVR
jgi:hypothetical protein